VNLKYGGIFRRAYFRIETSRKYQMKKVIWIFSYNVIIKPAEGLWGERIKNLFYHRSFSRMRYLSSNPFSSNKSFRVAL